jgi:hypothetical protein
MLAATPINGGHYFVDLIAGIVIAVFAIVAARSAGHVIARWQPGFARPAAIGGVMPEPMADAVPAE